VLVGTPAGEQGFAGVGFGTKRVVQVVHGKRVLALVKLAQPELKLANVVWRTESKEETAAQNRGPSASPPTVLTESRLHLETLKVESRNRNAWPVYVSIALSGACALAAEVVWTRLLSLMLGATVYTFSIILAIFLVGLGIGSGIGSLLARAVARFPFVPDDPARLDRDDRPSRRRCCATSWFQASP